MPVGLRQTQVEDKLMLEGNFEICLQIYIYIYIKVETSEILQYKFIGSVKWRLRFEIFASQKFSLTSVYLQPVF